MNVYVRIFVYLNNRRLLNRNAVIYNVIALSIVSRKMIIGTKQIFYLNCVIFCFSTGTRGVNGGPP